MSLSGHVRDRVDTPESHPDRDFLFIQGHHPARNDNDSGFTTGCTQLEQRSSSATHADLHLQPHEERAQLPPPFFTHELNTNTKPHTSFTRPSSTRILATLLDGPVKNVVNPFGGPRYLAALIDVLYDLVEAPRLLLARYRRSVLCSIDESSSQNYDRKGTSFAGYIYNLLFPRIVHPISLTSE